MARHAESGTGNRQAPRAGVSVRRGWYVAVGLALLYASGFYLSIAGSYFLYFRGRQVLFPTAMAILVLSPLGYWFYMRYGNGARSSMWSAFVIAVLVWIALVSAFSAVGYSALDVALLISGRQSLGGATRGIRVTVVIVGVGISVISVQLLRSHWRGIFRLLSTLGYAYALMAVLRIDHPSEAFFGPHVEPSPPVGESPRQEVGTKLESAPPEPKFRQVIWVVFDELDYGATLGQPAERQNPPMPNLRQLASMGVSASDAFSPAKDTIVSLPMLLTGYPSIGQDFEDGRLRLKTRFDGIRVFKQSDSIFGRLPDGPNSAAILGFYHPYCGLFPAVQTCVASPYLNVGRWFDALVFFGQQAIETVRFIPGSAEFFPGGLFRWFEPMYRITEYTLREFPQFLAMENKSLVFVHVNLPHLPGDYSQRSLHLKTVGDDHEVYRHNLQVVDQMLGQAISILQDRSKRQSVLLIVSSDHWFRVESPSSVQRIPWIAWHVGESEGINLSTRISTIHTSELVLSFLQGHVNNQQQISDWWQDKSFYPTLMPHGFKY